MELEKTLAMLLAGTALAVAPVLAQEVGTAAAVNPDSQSTPPGGSTTTLKVGARVVHKERIKTTPTGSVQLLFLDRSTLSIAPNSEIVIDEFVYKPGEGSGRMVTSLTKGALRFVGGQLSHGGQATVNTPNATIGIRGGTSIITLTEAINVNGLLTMGNGCPQVKRPGFKIMLPCGPITQVTAAELQFFIRIFGGSWGGERRGAGPNQRAAQRAWYHSPCVSSGQPPSAAEHYHRSQQCRAPGDDARHAANFAAAAAAASIASAVY
jgi:FecR protein